MKTIFFFAGEQSGDQLGASLMQQLKVPHKFWGVGGPAMRAAGLECFIPSESFAVMGFSDVILALPKLLFLLGKIAKKIVQEAPEAVVLIDYAEFNMLLAKKLRKKGYAGKIIHYVSPSVWAWRKNRVKTLSKHLDHLISILPFEKKFFANTKLDVTYVGHPLVNKVANYLPQKSFKKDKPIIALFPGSRKTEVLMNLKLQLKSASPFIEKGYALFISIANERIEPLIRKMVQEMNLEAEFVPQSQTYDLMRECDAALATCGTVILELGLHEKKTIVTYKIGLFNYIVGRYLARIKLPYFSLPNIILNRELFPEFIHRKLSTFTIQNALEKLLDQKHPTQDFKELKDHLQSYNASAGAAATISSLISK